MAFERRTVALKYVSFSWTVRKASLGVYVIVKRGFVYEEGQEALNVSLFEYT